MKSQHSRWWHVFFPTRLFEVTNVKVWWSSEGKHNACVACDKDEFDPRVLKVKQDLQDQPAE